MRKPELPPLTGVRFYAALLVYLSHVTMIPGAGAVTDGLLLFNAGVVGVSFFFVLSGFILTYNYADMFRPGVATADYKRFVRDRFAKIYPVHLLTLLMVLPLAMFSPNLPLDWRAVPFHLLLMQCFLPFATPTFFEYLNVPSWSISCEWFFYLFTPTVIFLVMDRKRFWIPLVVTVIYAATLGWILSGHSDFTRLFVVSWFAPSRIPEFLAGVYLGRYYLRGGLGRSDAGVAIQAAGLLLIVLGAVARSHAPWPLSGGLLYLPGSVLLVWGLASGRGFLASHLSGPFLHRLGMASFSFYLVHAPVLRYFRGAFARMGWSVNSWAAFSVLAAVLLILIQGLALAVHYLYELPAQRHLQTPRSFAPSPAFS